MTEDRLKEKIQERKQKRCHSTGTGASRRPKRRKKIGIKRLAVMAAATLGILLILTGAAIFIVKTVKENAKNPETGASGENPLDALTEDIPEGVMESESVGSGVLEHIVKAFRASEEAYGLRPEEVILTEENMADFVSVDECKIDSETGHVKVCFSSDKIPASDDKFYYLFEIKSYDDSGNISELQYVDRTYKGVETSMGCSLLANTAESRLYKKFGVAVKLDGEYKLVSTPSFLTNPEAIAKHTGHVEAKSKKGILIDYNRVFTGQLEDLGVSQAAINIPINSIMGPTTNPLFPSIHYNYNGKSYTFNGVVIAGFDSTVSALTKKGIQTTAILLNSYTSGYIDLIHPDARSKGVCLYYMFNGSTDEGVDILAAVSSFLAERYSGDAHGKISNWVIANEINARKEWNYLKYCDVDTYSKEYAKGFRVMYTAIKSTNSGARVMISLDQTWNRKVKNSPDYDGRDVLDSFNQYISSQGNIDWALAYHPYNIPLTSCKTWSSSKYISHSADTPTISMQNIEVLVNYLNKENYLKSDGECRDIMITELGYTSSAGQDLQAAAIAYAYYKVDYYKEIKGLLLNRQTDDATEIAQGLATGITTAGGGIKSSYNVFKYMDTNQREKYTDFAKSIIGISDWKQIIY